ncbi:MAG TPA: hypothetical protein VFF79_18845 [Conexibacter sp.]|nr:hypothetical protein [Conexibacter sp.]
METAIRSGADANSGLAPRALVRVRGSGARLAGRATHGRLGLRLDIGREVEVDGEQFGSVRLAYASHVTREQGTTVTRGVALTGGWQTARATPATNTAESASTAYRPPRPRARSPARGAPRTSAS